MQIAAVDLGFGWTKALAGERQIVEPSVVGPGALLFEGMGGKKGLKVWDPDGKEYFVGRLAVSQSGTPWQSLGDDKPNNPHTLRLLRAVLAAVAPVPNGTWTIDWLVSGLPMQLWAQQQKDLERLLAGFHGTRVQAELDGQRLDLTITVKGTYVMVQPYGTLLDYVLDHQGAVARQDLEQARVLVVDVGYHTVDLLAAKGIRPISPLCVGTNFGLATALKELTRKLNKPSCVVDVRVVEKEVELPEAALEIMARNIEAQVEGLNEQFDLFLVTGGGGQRVLPYLRLRGRSELVKDPQMANVRGYAKVGRRLARKALAT